MKEKTIGEKAYDYTMKINESHQGFFNTHTVMDAYLMGAKEVLGTQEQQRRYEIAKECLAGLCSRVYTLHIDEAASLAINIADELIKRLQGEGKNGNK